MSTGDVRIKISVHVIGTKEPIVAMDGTSDNVDALLIAARGVLDQTERVLSTPAPTTSNGEGSA